jgi:hypothetical protein
MLFGTLFFANYLTRALVLYRSMEAHFRDDFTLVCLCMDEDAATIIEQLKLPRVSLLRISELEDRDRALLTVKSGRTIGEYSWTCTPVFMRYLLDRAGGQGAAAYLDADLMFFADPQPVFDEWHDSDILIHAHRYASRHRHLEPNAGIYNVALVAMRDSEEADRCLTRWRAQCLDACTIDNDRGLCGDQKYLDEWPQLYRRLTIFQHPGAGLAPWNIEQYELTDDPSGPVVEGKPVIFYHYHALRLLVADLFAHSLMVPSAGYDFTHRQLRLIYRPYAAALRSAYREAIACAAGDRLPRPQLSLADLRRYRRRLFVA